RIYRYDDRDFVQPTIAVHYASSSPHYSSICLLQQDEDTSTLWEARGVKVKLESGSEYSNSNWKDITSYDIVGYWQTGFIDDYSCGVSSAIIDPSFNEMWGACGSILSLPGNIIAAYGDTE
ncbi:MAG: hypothetical protein ABIC40_06850, partial [bacterium]